MNPPRSPLFVTMVALVGGLAATFAGWKLAGPNQKPAGASTIPANQRSSSGRPRPETKSSPPAWAAVHLQLLGNTTTATERMRAIVAFANAVPMNKIPKWLDGGWFPAGEGFAPVFFRELLANRWQLADAAGFARWQLFHHPQDAHTLLTQLAKTDPAGVIALFNDRPSGWIEARVMAAMAEFHPAIAIDRLIELVTRGVWRDEFDASQVLNSLAAHHPAVLEAAMDQLSPYLKNRAKDGLAGQRLVDSFDQEIRRLWEDPDGWMRFHNNISRDGMLDKLIGEIPNLPASWRQSIASGDWFITANPQKWWLVDLEGGGFTAEQARKIRLKAMDGMIRSQPETAITWIDAMELTGKERTQMVETLFLQSAPNPDKSAELILKLRTPEDRKTAQAIVDRRAQNQSTQIPEIEDPGEWLEKFGATTPTSGESGQYTGMLRDWPPEKISVLAAQLRELPEELKIKTATRLLAKWCDYSSDSGPVLHGESLRCLLESPGKSPELIGKTSLHSVKWAQRDPAAASDWIDKLPTGDARQWAQKNLAAYWIQYDPAATKRWLDTLPKTEQSQVRNFIETKPQPR